METFVNYEQPITGSDAGRDAKREFLETIDDLSQNKNLHGLYIVSNGDKGLFVIPPENNQADWGPSWSVEYSDGTFGTGNNYTLNDSNWYISRSLNYHLGACIIHTCDGASNMESLASGSDAVTWGYAGKIIPTYNDVKQYWIRVKKDGNGNDVYYYKQGTRYSP